MKIVANEILISAVGDIMLGDLPQCNGFGVGSQIEKHGPLFPFGMCAPLLKKADVVVGNLEAALSNFDKFEDSFSEIVLRGKPAAAKGLKEAGFGVLSLANNHIMQHGRKAFEDTLEALASEGIKSIGVRHPERGIDNHVTVGIKGRRLCFAAYNLRPVQYFLASPLYAEGDPAKMIDEVAALKAASDIVVLSLHWGEEFVDRPAPEQVELAHHLVESGADVILGHHPHMVQPIEKYKGAVIAYSLGNFVFDMWQARLRRSLILNVTIADGPSIDYDIVPVEINRKHQPVPLDNPKAAAVRKYYSDLGQGFPNGDSPADYNLNVRRELYRYRREVYWHYLTHIFRYNPRMFASNFYGAIRRRTRAGGGETSLSRSGPGGSSR